MTTPYKFQVRDAKRIEEFGGRCLLASEMGTGKTFTTLLWAKRYLERGPVVIVCPATIKTNWQRECRLHIGVRAVILDGRKPPPGGLKDNPSKWYIINYDLLGDPTNQDAWVNVLYKIRPQLVVADECFPYQTEILTDSGYLKIGDIVENKLPIQVASFDFLNNVIDWKPVTHYFKNRRHTRLVRVFHSEGVLHCTENHKVWTEEHGFIEAGKLTAGNHLRMVWESPTRSERGETESDSTILWKELLSEMESESAFLEKDDERNTLRKSDQNINLAKNPVSNEEGENESKGVFAPNEEKEPDAHEWRSGQNDLNEDEERHTTSVERRSWRQRQTVPATTETIVHVSGQMDCRIPNQNEKESTVPTLLQSGSCPTGENDRDRNRRTRTQLAGQSPPRQQEGKTTHLTRVDRVEIYEQENRQNSEQSEGDNRFVYCLEVKDHHNFYAEGILVSNCHYIKSPDAQRTKAFRHLARRAPHAICISGTPLTNRPKELYPSLNVLRPDLYDSFWSYGIRYCAPRRTPWGWDFNGASHLDELHETLSEHLMVRTLKKEVLDQLPNKTRTIVPLEIENRREYTMALTQFIRWLRKQSKSRAKKAVKAERLVQLGYLRRLAGQLKVKNVVNWLHEFFEESDEKLILFAVHKAVIQEIKSRFSKVVVVVDGSVTGAKRQAAIDSFNDRKSKVRLLIGNVQAAGVGWSCKSTSQVAFAELPWVPGELTQAEDRIHGIGRGTGGAAYTYLVARDTIEENLIKILQTKQDVLDRTLDGKEGASRFDILSKLESALVKRAKVSRG